VKLSRTEKRELIREAFEHVEMIEKLLTSVDNKLSQNNKES
jgi:hypothetical protein